MVWSLFPWQTISWIKWIFILLPREATKKMTKIYAHCLSYGGHQILMCEPQKRCLHFGGLIRVKKQRFLDGWIFDAKKWLLLWNKGSQFFKNISISHNLWSFLSFLWWLPLVLFEYGYILRILAVVCFQGFTNGNIMFDSENHPWIEFQQ